MFRTWLAHEGAHVDQAGREDVAGAVDRLSDLGRFRRGAPGDIGDYAVADEDSAPALAVCGGVDQASVSEQKSVGHLNSRGSTNAKKSNLHSSTYKCENGEM